MKINEKMKQRGRKCKRQIQRQEIATKIKNEESDDSRRPLSSDELEEMFGFIDKNITAQFGIAKLSKLNLNQQNESKGGTTLLHYAVSKNRDVIVMALLRAGACPLSRYNCPVHRSCPGTKELARLVRNSLLLRSGACLAWIAKVIVALSCTVEECCCMLKFRRCGHEVAESEFWNHFITQRSFENICCPQCLCPIIRFNFSSNNEDSVDMKSEEQNSITKHQSLALFSNLPYDAQTCRAPVKRITFQAQSPHDAAGSLLGLYQTTRLTTFHAAVCQGNLTRVKATIEAGVDIDWRNEYGQTALFLSVWYREPLVSKYLMHIGADMSIPDNAGTTVSYDESVDAFSLSDLPFLSIAPVVPNAMPDDMTFQCLINVGSDHPGAGSFMIDNWLGEDEIETLTRIFKELPVAPPEKLSCSARSYYCDSRGVTRRILDRGLSWAKMFMESEHLNNLGGHKLCEHSLPHMRYLEVQMTFVIAKFLT